MYFSYGETELSVLKSCDVRMAAAIEEIGIIKRKMVPDLFTAMVHSIISQQISNKARDTIWGRLRLLAEGVITPERILNLSEEKIRSCGISARKAANIVFAAKAILSEELQVEKLAQQNDQSVIATLSALPGIGVWTAEMLLLFSLGRPNILSYGDAGIQRGLRILFNETVIDKKVFEYYKQKFSPYGSVASLYLWEIVSRKKEEMK
ncbi:MAG: DNA-3-methyladenine glycosylase 2 family protein [Clostridia bacterium]|nr:DNA-3-methyladenine glycosylase 2 family protein [Clostridia bacterium]